MRKVRWLAVLGLAVLSLTSSSWAQQRPYIGFVYPAGGQQGTTFRIRLGGQGVDEVDRVVVSGPGVTVKVVDIWRRIGNQEMGMIREQLSELRKVQRPFLGKDGKLLPNCRDANALAAQKYIDRIEYRISEYVFTPACQSISNLTFADVTIAPDAPPGQREIRVASQRGGVSNPLVFYIGQVPEHVRKPMISATIQTLGKEENALRKRPPDEAEANVVVPCTLNGQIASGEVNRYRFEARKGQKLLMAVKARDLVPFIADAVPGWFQPVIALYDANGKEVAYCDDYRFKPDPIIFYEVPKTGQYVLSIFDAIYRGREDFVYRITVGELPYITGVFPLGASLTSLPKLKLDGWNLEKALMAPPVSDGGPGIYSIAATSGRYLSNAVPFAIDDLPEVFSKEPNHKISEAQPVTLPVMINGRIGRPDENDVFQFKAKAGDTVVAEVYARRLESPLDSIVTITDADSKVLAVNDDHEDPTAGINTHEADSYCMVKLPADGTYYVHIGDAARNGGPDYAYRLRISEPRPDFALLAVPSSLTIRPNSSNGIEVRAIRKDGYAGPITVTLKNPAMGFTAQPATIGANQTSTRLNVKTTLGSTPQPVSLAIEGLAKTPRGQISHLAVAVEDKMQAFLWRHLVPAKDLEVVVMNPSWTPAEKRVRKTPASAPCPDPATARPAAVASTVPKTTTQPGKGKFSKNQVATRLREINYLFQEWLITEDFANRKIAECETPQ